MRAMQDQHQPEQAVVGGDREWQERSGSVDRRFRTIFDNGGVGIFVADTSGLILEANPAFSQLLGYRPDELRHRHARELTHPEDFREPGEFFARWADGRDETLRQEKRYVHKDGSIVWTQQRASLVRDERGAPAYAICVVEDITQRKEAEAALRESESRFRAVFERAALGISICDTRPVLLDLNPALAAMLGYTLEELRTIPVDAVSHPEDMARDLAYFQELLRGERDVYTIEKRYFRKGGTTMIGRLTVTLAAPTRDGTPYVIGLLEDITEQRTAEQAIAQHVAELQAANAQLREADRYKDEFLSIISHELRTPLNFITGFASILADEVHGPLNAEQRQDVARIMSGADRMLRLVNDLLDVARIQAGRLEIDPAMIAIAPVLDDACASLWPAADAKHLRLGWQGDRAAIGWIDGSRLFQVLTNLIGNAVKFTPAGGAIELTVKPAGQSLRFEVSDTGIGIPADEQAQLFTRFKQINMSSTREVGGFGLGLAISKAIVEAHGGTIGVRSALGQGSTFWFELPMKKS